MIYTIRDSQGQIVRTLSCPEKELEHHLGAGEHAEPGEAAIERPVRQLTYRERRVAEYPPLSEQIDAIMKGGADLEAMRERVLAVKARFPKG